MSGAPRSVAAAAPRAAGAPAAPAVAAVDVGRTPARADVVRLATGKFASNALAFTDCGYVSVEDFRAVAENSGAWPTAGDAGEEAKARSLAQHGLPVKINSRCVLTLKELKDIPVGTLALSAFHRELASLSLAETADIAPYRPPPGGGVLAKVSFTVEPLMKAKVKEAVVIDVGALAEIVKSVLDRHVVQLNQSIAIDFKGLALKLVVQDVEHIEIPGARRASEGETATATGGVRAGQIMKLSTVVAITKARDAMIKIQGSTGDTKKLFERGFNFVNLGIGGLDKEFEDIFRRAFASRVLPADELAGLGIKHVRGMLLYGPPGCGKTLIARQLGKALHSREPKVVNGPEILNKYVGASEENIRNLFADAEKEQEEAGNDSELHIIIFDEIDAICKARGSSRDGTGVHDSIVNQLLSKIDGVDALNNILIIGMTNRLDMIDEALLRPGRLEVHVEIGLPSEDGRNQILNIHTAVMKKNGFLSPEVDIVELARLTKNYTGAEIEGLVRDASGYAQYRAIDPRTLARIAGVRIVVTMEDFLRAVENTRPAFGSKDEEMKGFYEKYGVQPFSREGHAIVSTLQKFTRQVRDSDATPLLSVLLQGAPGSGKSAIASKYAVESGFPFVKRIGGDTVVGYSESAKAAHIVKVFSDAYRSPVSIIILDDIERLLEYVDLGPRFSNVVLQTLLVVIKRPPPTPTGCSQRKLFVIGTTSQPRAMEALGLDSVFSVCLDVPLLQTTDEVRAVLASFCTMDAGDAERAADLIKTPIAIKRLLLGIDMARQAVRAMASHDGAAAAMEPTIALDVFERCMGDIGMLRAVE